MLPSPTACGERFQGWLTTQEAAGRAFTEEQIRWLGDIRDHNRRQRQHGDGRLQYAPSSQQGGLGKAHELFGDELRGCSKSSTWSWQRDCGRVFTRIHQDVS